MAVPEMEKRADAADTSVLFFSLAVLIFWPYTRNVDDNIVLLALCEKQCTKETLL